MGTLRAVWVVGIGVALTTVANAESLNVNFGPAGATPSSSYAAAGGAGTWNTVTGVSGMHFNLIATDGTPGIELSQSPTTTLLATTDGAVTGDDATLLNNGLVTSNAETCLMFSGFQPGTYEVLIYAWLPNQSAVKSRTRQDEAPATIDVGGSWPGGHAEGVTYARYIVDVGADGLLPAHSGLVPGAPAGALNGVQIRPLVPGMPGGVDAGVSGGGDDAGTDVGPGTHGGGCNTTGEHGGGLVIALALAGVVRRRRRRG